VVKRTAHKHSEERRPPGVTPPSRLRLTAANDNVPPLSFTLKRALPLLLLAAAAMAWWLLG